MTWYPITIILLSYPAALVIHEVGVTLFSISFVTASTALTMDSAPDAHHFWHRFIQALSCSHGSCTAYRVMSTYKLLPNLFNIFQGNNNFYLDTVTDVIAPLLCASRVFKSAYVALRVQSWYIMKLSDLTNTTPCTDVLHLLCKFFQFTTSIFPKPNNATIQNLANSKLKFL